MARFSQWAAFASLFVFTSLNLSAQEAAPKYVQIRNLKSGRVLAVLGDATGNGDKIIQLPFGRDPKEGRLEKLQWQIVLVDTVEQTFLKDNKVYKVKVPYFKIVNRKSGKVLDVPESSKEDGIQLTQWDYHGGANQQWSIEKHDNHYVIKARHSCKAVDVFGGSNEINAKIVQWSCGNGQNPNQAFVIVPVK